MKEAGVDDQRTDRDKTVLRNIHFLEKKWTILPSETSRIVYSDSNI